MTCKACREEIEDVGQGDGLSRAARAHIGACAACVEFQRTSVALSQLVGELGRVPAPDDFEFRLRARMRRGHTSPRGGFFAGLNQLKIATAVAACFLLALASIFYISQPTAQHQRAASTTPPAVDESPQAIQSDTQTADAQNADAVVEKVNAVANESDDNALGQRKHSKGTKAGNTYRRRERHELGNSFGVRNAPVVALVNPPVPVRLPRSKQPMRVVVRDESGAERVLSMRSVSFGSQELGRLNFSSRTSGGSKEGVW